jgi:pimeloyl-ACP methyl ester carboxylesterase
MARMPNQIGTFVLVHGAWSGGWCYHKVADRLRAQGHRVFTPTLTGQGERSHLIGSAINLSMHVTDVLNVFRYENLSDVVLAGHSYGGMVITAVGDRVASKIRALIYLDAFLPDDGRSLFDINLPVNNQRFIQAAGESGGLAVPSPPAAYFNVNAADAARVDTLATPFPLGCFTEKIKLTGAHTTIGKHVYVHSTVLPRESPFKPFYDRVRSEPAWQAHTLPCGHDAMLDMPDEVTAILEGALT